MRHASSCQCANKLVSTLWCALSCRSRIVHSNGHPFRTIQCRVEWHLKHLYGIHQIIMAFFGIFDNFAGQPPKDCWEFTELTCCGRECAVMLTSRPVPPSLCGIVGGNVDFGRLPNMDPITPRLLPARPVCEGAELKGSALLSNLGFSWTWGLSSGTGSAAGCAGLAWAAGTLKPAAWILDSGPALAGPSASLNSCTKH